MGMAKPPPFHPLMQLFQKNQPELEKMVLIIILLK
jgi:hypothetical protein